MDMQQLHARTLLHQGIVVMLSPAGLNMTTIPLCCMVFGYVECIFSLRRPLPRPVNTGRVRKDGQTDTNRRTIAVTPSSILCGEY